MTKYPFLSRRSPDGTTKPETDEEFHERVIACLEQLDSKSRLERAERHIWMGEQHVGVNGGYWERSETSAVLQEARSSYLHGNFIATLILALAYVEHVINDALPPAKRRTMATAIQQARAVDVGIRMSNQHIPTFVPTPMLVDLGRLKNLGKPHGI